MTREAPGGTELRERLIRRIERAGPMPVSQYVDACLYDPDGGFYMRGGRSGAARGHFLTSPEVGPLFGAVLARALDRWWEQLDRPAPFTVIDWGAGPGTLARTVLAAEPECAKSEALHWIAVELSLAQRALHPARPQVTTVAAVEEALDERPVVGVVIANELLDNLPFDIAQRTPSGWAELRVGAAAGGDSSAQFTLVSTPADPALTEVLPESIPEGRSVPVQQAARAWLAKARNTLDAGRIAVFDYGAETTVLASRTAPEVEHAFGWLRTHTAQRPGGSWLADPGTRDITADLAFDQLQQDLPAARVRTQANFLRANGIGELVAEGAATWANRAAIGDLDALAGRSRTSEAQALLSSKALGAHTVLEWFVTQRLEW